MYIKQWIIFRGDYPLTEAMNEAFRKEDYEVAARLQEKLNFVKT